MAFGKSNRMDGRRASSSYCSTTTIVVFVALCLVGVWMMTSTTVVPVEMSSQGTTKNPVTETDSPQSEDRSSDVTEDFVKEGDSGNNIPDESNTETSVGQNLQENTEELEGMTQTESSLKRKEEEDKTPAFNDANGNSDGEETVKEGGDDKHKDDESDGGERKDDENSKRSENDEEQQSGEKKLEQEELSDSETRQDEKGEDQVEKVEHIEDKEPGSKTKEVFPDGAQSELLNETSTQNGAWSTQAAESKSEKEKQASSLLGNQQVYSWQLCNVTSGPDYIPCLDNEKAIKKLHSTKHYQHRERHCPEQPPTCLVPLPDGYKHSMEWPNSRDKIWYYNVPHTKLAVVKGHQNWVKVSGEYLTFPGGGTQFKHGALHYIDFIQRSHSGISWGKQSRTVLDVGCGVASFGGYLFDRDVLAMSFAPKDEHEAQVQFALERGIPAISAVMGTKRLPFPSGVFDIVHCARCRVPWHIEGGMLLLELNRLLRPGGYFVWSATPVYQNLTEDVEIWNAMSALTKSMCWKMVNKTKDKLNEVGLAIFRKPTDNKCYETRTEENPPLCQGSDDPDAAWNVPLQACMHKVAVDPAIRGSQWPEQWPRRLETAPYWINNSQVGVYGKPASEDFVADYEHWKRVVTKSYVNGMGINWSNVRNVMDMKSIYGGFAAALRDMKVWVMNIVSIDSPDTLPIIYERGLFGMYHDWCESFSTYPRTYDLLHADHLFTKLKKRCKLLPVFVEMDRILRPEGKLIIRDTVETITEIERMAKSMQWEVRMTYSKDNEGLLCLQKTTWRPKEVEASM